jgi:FHS family Na+ dependent glucose MFS transporter 1
LWRRLRLRPLIGAHLVQRASSWPVAVRLYLVSFLVVGLSLSVLGPALTELRERTGSGIGGIGVLFAGQSVGYIVGSFLGGRLYDRIPGHRVFGGALLLLGLGLAFVPAFDGLNGLFATFVVMGFGASITDLGANALLLWQLGAGSGRAMNLLHLFFGLGALAAPLVVHIGLDITTRAAAILCAALAVWSFTIPSPQRPLEAREEHTDTTKPMLVLLAVFFTLYVGLEIGFAGWIKTYGEEISFSELAATWLTTVFWVAFTLGRLLASAIAHRVEPDRILAATCGLSIVAAVVLIIGNGGATTVWIGTVLMGIGTAPQFPAMLMLAERRIHVTGSATSWFVGGAGMGGLIFPWAIGRVFDSQGTGALPWAMLVLGVATFASFAIADKALHR